MLSKKIVKYIQSLSHKKLRDEENAFIAEGPKVVSELLVAGKFHCKIVCASVDWLDVNQNLLTNISSDNIYETGENDLERISFLKKPNKVIAVFEKDTEVLSPVIKNKLSLMLDDIQDPGNLGTIIRIANWFGIDTIICSEDCTDCYNPKVVQSTMGSLGKVNILYTSLISFIDENNYISVYAASLEGVSVYQLPPITEGIILIGNESKGINAALLTMVDTRITIPRFGNAESLNAAVAAGIIISHIKAS